MHTRAATVLEWVSVYWFSRAGPAAAARIYRETSGGEDGADVYRGTRWTSVPVGVAFFPREPIRLPQSCVFLVCSAPMCDLANEA